MLAEKIKLLLPLKINEYKIFFIRITALFFRRFYQLSPFEYGKWFIWKKVLEPYINNNEMRFVITTKYGSRFKVDLCDYIQQRLFYFGIWEPAVTKYIRDNLIPGDVFVDVGANIGYYACLASKVVGNRGTVHAVEASPSIYKLLCKNIDLNHESNIITYNIAASDHKAMLDIYKGSKTNIGQTTTRIEHSRKYQFKKESEIPADTLDKIIGLKTLLNARIVKIDVEGAEWQVVHGIAKLIPDFSKKTDFIIEISPEPLLMQGIHYQQLIQLFTDNGFNAYVIEEKSQPSEYMRSRPAYKVYPLSMVINGQADVLFTRVIFS
jgi:FkbM family methyltransferase